MPVSDRRGQPVSCRHARQPWRRRARSDGGRQLLRRELPAVLGLDPRRHRRTPAALASRPGACRWGCTSTSRSAGSAAISAISASTRTRTRTTSRSIWTSSAASGSCTRAAGDRRSALQLRLLRRRHAVVPLDPPAPAPRQAADGESILGHRRGDHVRVRARHAHRPKLAASAAWVSPGSASASRTSTIAFSS